MNKCCKSNERTAREESDEESAARGQKQWADTGQERSMTAGLKIGMRTIAAQAN
jgi:hypothetical protein